MSSCSPSDNELERYLKKMNIPIQETKIYLLIPAEQCGGCFSYDVSNLSDEVNRSLILVNAHAKASLKNFRNTYLDKDDHLYSLAFLNHTNTLAFSKNHKLSYVRVYHLKHQIDSIYQAMRLTKTP